MWLFSTGLKNALLGKVGTGIHAVAASTISMGDGDGSGGRDTINDAGTGLVDFTLGDSLTIIGGTNDGVTTQILSVTAGTIEVAAGTLTAEAAGSTIILLSCEGGSFAEVFKNGVARLYSGSVPASADNIPSGSMLCEITKNGSTFVSGSPDNGINFGQVSAGNIGAAVDPVTGITEVWKGTPVLTGTALSVWVFANTVDTTASTTAIRMCGSVSTSGAEFNMAGGTSLTAGVDVTVDSVVLSL